MLPVGYGAGVRAYQKAISDLTVGDLSNHYTLGLAFFNDEFVPYLKRQLKVLSGDAWDLDEFVAYAAGADTDLMAHIIEGVGRASVFPGDWHGFRVGVSRPDTVQFETSSRGRLACLCVPSVRNGNLTEGMLRFLSESEACLLNINLYPTLTPAERHDVAEALRPVMAKSLISVSFSRGFGLTASQLGVLLVHKDHPLRARFKEQWEWHTYFHNAIAARAFMALDFKEVGRVDDRRRGATAAFLDTHGLPSDVGGSYYVKAFRLLGDIPRNLVPLARDGLVRLCLKPDAT